MDSYGNAFMTSHVLIVQTKWRTTNWKHCSKTRPKH